MHADNLDVYSGTGLPTVEGFMVARVGWKCRICERNSSGTGSRIDPARYIEGQGGTSYIAGDITFCNSIFSEVRPITAKRIV